MYMMPWSITLIDGIFESYIWMFGRIWKDQGICFFIPLSGHNWQGFRDDVWQDIHNDCWRYIQKKLAGYGEVGSLQSLACLAIENLVRKSLDQVAIMILIILIMISMIIPQYADVCVNADCWCLQDHQDHRDQQQNNNQHSNHDHHDDDQVKDPGCRALISLTPEQQERAETIHGFVQVTNNYSKALNIISQCNGHDKTKNTFP